MANKRNAKVELTLDKRPFDRGIDAAGRRLRGFSRDGRKSLANLSGYGNGTSAWKKIGGDIGRLGRAGGVKLARAGLLGLGGAAAATAVGMASMAGDVVDLERGLTRFQIATNMSDSDMARFRGQLAGVSRDSGVNRQALLDGAAAYVALTGDAAGAAAQVELFAQVVNASGTPMEDVAAVAAAMKDNLKINPSEFKAGFSALVVQGKAGAIELKDLAAELSGIAPSFSQFQGGGGVAGLVEMGAALQVVRKGFGSSAEAATGMRALMVSLQRNAGKFGKGKVFTVGKDGKKQLRDFSDIIDSIAESKLAKDPTRLSKAFGSDEAKRAFDQLVQNRALLDELVTVGGDSGAIDRDAAKYLESPAGRMTKAWEAVKLKMMEAFTPERIEKFAGALEKVVMLAAKAADLLDKLLTGGEKEGSLLSVEQLAGASNMSTRFGNQRTMPGAGAFKSDEAIFYGRALGGEGDYDLGKLFRYSQAVGNGNRAPQSATQIAGQVAGAVPGGDAVRQVMDGMLAAAARMQFTVQIDGNAIAKASANAPTHRTRPGGV